ncbi:uncharacterized protein LOC114397402 [Glycine soja]|uniref:uncharacterized protein LOC114397402 n=1 Tax=Glycine soja TaxID=3848 RepID=UPI001038E88F|nr:uncharacterized protein LOC114397402 [Glycine soja]
MAEATRSKASADHWEEAFARLSSSKFDELLHRMTQLETEHASPRVPSPSPGATTTNPTYRMKLEVSRFNGSDPEGWIFKITQFFEYHATPDHERLTIASFYMEGLALAWFQWMHRNGQLSSWSTFLHAIHARFLSSTYEDPTGLLCKLTQRSIVSAYLSEFEALANRIIGLLAPFVLSCFVSGLNPVIQREVQVMQPHSLVQYLTSAIKSLRTRYSDFRGLLLKSDLVHLPKSQQLDGRRSSVRTSPSLSYSFPSRLSPPVVTKPVESLLTPSPTKPAITTIPFKCLSPEELAIRREKGLCFNYDEKYSRGHKCTPSLFLFVTEDEECLQDSDSNPSSPTALVASQETSPAQISLHALSGHGAPETFLQPQTTSTLRVTVGNGEELQCNQVCPKVAVHIQAHTFLVDFHILPICGADVVLGVQWLKSLGPVLTDYATLTMKFIYNDKLIELKGDRDANIDQISPSQLRRLMNTGNTSTYFHIQLDSHHPEPLPLTHSIPAIQTLLTKYSSLFQPLTNLPPSRATDHSINLLPNSTPINVRPYRYPYFQKQEIERQVALMLRNGHIQHSSSPFSSPVLLVKKRDGTWRFCMDYRALNAITVRDRFPIPTVDELLDELGGATWFSKLDLMQGYHQILMKESDTSKTAFRTHHGHYEFHVMPFGLCNAPSLFQATMNRLFQPHLRKYIIVFFDDILIYSHSFRDHLEVAF